MGLRYLGAEWPDVPADAMVVVARAGAWSAGLGGAGVLTSTEEVDSNAGNVVAGLFWRPVDVAPFVNASEGERWTGRLVAYGAAVRVASATLVNAVRNVGFQLQRQDMDVAGTLQGSATSLAPILFPAAYSSRVNLIRADVVVDGPVPVRPILGVHYGDTLRVDDRTALLAAYNETVGVGAACKFELVVHLAFWPVRTASRDAGAVDVVA